MGNERDDARLYRYGGIAGLGAIILLTASLPLAPPWPPASAGSGAVAAYFTEYRAGFLTQAWVATGGVTLLVPFAAALAALFRGRGRTLTGGTVFGALLLFVGAFGINWIPWIEIAFRPDRPRDIVLALYDFGLLGQFVGVGMPLALLFGAVAVGTLDGAVLPRWLAWLAIVCVPLNVALAASTALSGAFSPNGPIGFASIGLFTVFGVAASISMLRRAQALSRLAVRTTV
jgi:hypothetical protein